LTSVADLRRVARAVGRVAGSAAMIEARGAGPEDLTPLAGALARAFHDDPVMVWLLGERDEPRLRRLRRFMGSEARRHSRHGGTVLTADGHPGAALWDPPGRWRMSWVDIVRATPVMISGVGPRIPRALGGLSQMDKTHPREPHWYLAVLGTDPPHQGKGVGAALMAPVLARCDAEGTGAYLESSKPDNVPYYERFGFRVTGQIDMPKGPTMWPMWRDPQ
jgi:GNAT superfamily N-acetyltransferase